MRHSMSQAYKDERGDAKASPHRWANAPLARNPHQVQSTHLAIVENLMIALGIIKVLRKTKMTKPDK